jgi:hypothetical protein
MKLKICSCGCDTLRIEFYKVNGGGAGESICTQCGKTEELWYDYDDSNS